MREFREIRRGKHLPDGPGLTGIHSRHRGDVDETVAIQGLLSVTVDAGIRVETIEISTRYSA